MARHTSDSGCLPHYAGTLTETRAQSAAQPGARSWLSRKLQKLTADDRVVDAQELRSEAAIAGC